MPERERIEALAAHQASMAVYLSAGMLQELAERLMAGGYPADTPGRQWCTRPPGRRRRSVSARWQSWRRRPAPTGSARPPWCWWGRPSLTGDTNVPGCMTRILRPGSGSGNPRGRLRDGAGSRPDSFLGEREGSMRIRVISFTNQGEQLASRIGNAFRRSR